MYISVVTLMGKRKPRFDVRKNFDRNKAAQLRRCIVSIPLNLVSIVHHDTSLSVPGSCKRKPENLVVRLPVLSYTSSSAPNAENLQLRLSRSNMLPAGWSMHLLQSSDDCLTALALYKLRITPPQAPLFTARCMFMLTIAHDCTWTLCVGRYMYMCV